MARVSQILSSILSSILSRNNYLIPGTPAAIFGCARQQSDVCSHTWTFLTFFPEGLTPAPETFLDQPFHAEEGSPEEILELRPAPHPLTGDPAPDQQLTSFQTGRNK